EAVEPDARRHQEGEPASGRNLGGVDSVRARPVGQDDVGIADRLAHGVGRRLRREADRQPVDALEPAANPSDGRRGRGQHHPGVDAVAAPVTNSPPSTLMMLPLIQSESVSDSVTIASATSCVVVIRPCGFRASVTSIIRWFSGILRSAGVSVTPARIEFTATPVSRRANSIASCRTCDSIAALAPDTTPYDGTTRLVPSDVIA